MTNEEICNIALADILGAGTIGSLADLTPQGRACNRWFELSRDLVLKDFDWNFARKRLEMTKIREVEFDAGQTAAPGVGATVTQDSDTYGTVVYVDLQSGSWSGNDAAGVIILSSPEGTFDDDSSITWSGGQATVNEPDGYGTTDYLEYLYSYKKPDDCLAPRYIINTASDNAIKYEQATDQSKNVDIILTDQDEAVLVYTAKITNPTRFDDWFCLCLAYRLAASLVQSLRGDLKLEDTLMAKYQHFLLLSQSRSANINEIPPKDYNELIESRK